MGYKHLNSRQGMWAMRGKSSADVPIYGDEAEPVHRLRLTDALTVKRFIYAGNATFTVVSNETGTRYTYRIRESPPDFTAVSHFVHVLTGPDNIKDFTYFGNIFRADLHYWLGKKSHLRPDD